MCRSTTTTVRVLTTGGGEGALVFKGGYHAQVWPLKIDPKLGIWVDSKSNPKQGFLQDFHTLN